MAGSKEPQSKCLVKWTQGDSHIVPNKQLSGDEDAEVSEVSKALRQLVDLEETIQQNEKQLKKELREWSRKEDQRRRQRAAGRYVDPLAD